MTRGKHKRKHQHARDCAHDKHTGPDLDERVVAADEAKPPSKAANDNKASESEAGMKKLIAFAGRSIASAYAKVQGWLARSSFTDWCLSAFTLGLIWIGYLQVNVMRNDQRAWLIPTVKGKKIDDPTFDTRVITLTNPGKTAAKDVAADLFLEVIPNDGTIPHFGGGFPHVAYTAGVVWPNSATPDVLEISRMDKDMRNRPITDAEKTALTEGKAWIAVHGVFEYSDVFHQRHWVQFCNWENFAKAVYLSAKSCSDYNGEGDTKPEKPN